MNEALATPIDRAIKWRNLSLLALAELLAMALWFSATAVVPQLRQEWTISTFGQAWLTTSVQIGFVAGALICAIFNLPDRINTRMFFAVSAAAGALCTASIAWLPVDATVAILLRMLTGACLAGVYPPGMKLMATWCKEDRGLGIGILVGALAVGSASPHLLNALPIFGEGGMPPWRSVLLTTSAMAVIGGVITAAFFRPGPYLSKSPPFNWRYSAEIFRHRPTRLANFGYLGHMWELYAMWTWAPAFLLASYEAAGWNTQAGRLAGFAVVAIGGVGCVAAGALADRAGRTTTTIASLIISGLCCLAAGALFHSPGLLTVLCLLWGFAVVADSAQFSTAVSELADPRYVGTALTIQTSVGFLLTLFTIQLIGVLRDLLGWSWVFAILAAGPAFGIWSMWRLRRLPEAAQMASGNR